MNIMYCGDKNIEDGLIISVLSLLRNAGEPLDIRVLTLSLDLGKRKLEPVSQEVIDFLDDYLKRDDPENRIVRIDMSEPFSRELPKANMNTRFTPCCMLRLYADEVESIPDRILYLDNDVVCRKPLGEFYRMDLTGHEAAGVLDYYGRWFFRRSVLHRDYMNSGVLLLNMKMIRRTGLFRRCRKMCQTKKMFMPDQSAFNKLCNTKLIVSRRYNEQRKLHRNTVLQHFTTSFRFLPWLHTVTVKPWQIEKVHSDLGLHEYDNIFSEYTDVKSQMKGAYHG
ncbi:MAG: glycosyltransferase [Anaerovoracaceae bacterium]|jgi:lipopolysaccharide biosynthesis glycosyltransferase